MNNRGQVQYLIGALILIIGILAYFLLKSPDFSPTINSITAFWNSIKYWILGLIILIVLWRIGLFKALAGK